MNPTVKCLFSAILLTFGAGVLLADENPLAAVPWIGDGLPDRNGADWYDEDPAPEFRATFTLPEGTREAKVHFACAGFGWFHVVGGEPVMCMDGLDTLWTPYDKTVYAKTFTVKTGAGTCDVVVRLGNGFYNLPPLRFWGGKCFRSVLAHGRPCFKLAVEGVEKPLEWRWRRNRRDAPRGYGVEAGGEGRGAEGDDSSVAG